MKDSKPHSIDPCRTRDQEDREHRRSFGQDGRLNDRAKPGVDLAETFEEKCGIGATESERIRQHVLEIGIPALIGNVVQIAIRIRIFVVDRRRYHLILEGEYADPGFDGSCRTQ